MAIEVQDMAVFLAVIREGSFGRASTALFVSQPAVSERVVRLERAVGAQLFIRGNRGATPTPAGERLIPYAQRAIDLVAEAADAVRSLDEPPRLRVAVHSTFAHRAVPIVVEALAHLPRSLKFRDAHSDEIVSMLLDGVVDIGFVLPGTTPRGVRFVSLPADPVMCVSGPDHPLGAKPSVSLSDLADTYVALNTWGEAASDFLDGLRRSGVAEWRWRECSDAGTAVLLARDHGHVALVTQSAVTGALADGSLIRLNVRPRPTWTVPLALAFRESERSDPAVVAVTAAARQTSRRASLSSRRRPSGRA